MSIPSLNPLSVGHHYIFHVGYIMPFMYLLYLLQFSSLHTPDFVLTHFLLAMCCSEPPAVKLNWCPPHDEYKPSTTPSVTAPIGCTQYPLLVCFRFPLSKMNSSLVNKAWKFEALLRKFNAKNTRKKSYISQKLFPYFFLASSGLSF